MKRTIALAATLAVASVSHASTYIRPQIAYLIPEASSADGAVGLFAALGWSPGEKPQHDFEIEVGWAKWNLDESGEELGLAFTGSADFTVVPVLANYRFNADLGKGMTGYVQFGAGMARTSLDWSIEIDELGVFSGSDSATGFAYGAGAGLTWRMGQKTAFNLGYRYIDVGSMEIDVEGETADVGDQAAHVIEAGFVFRF